MSEKDDRKKDRLDSALEKMSVPGLRNHLDKVLSEIQKRRENVPPDPTSVVQNLAVNGFADVALSLYMRQNPEVSRSDAEKVLQKYIPTDKNAR